MMAVSRSKLKLEIICKCMRMCLDARGQHKSFYQVRLSTFQGGLNAARSGTCL